MAHLPMVNDATFHEEVERAKGLMVVDFTAAWCPPCRILAPILEQIAADYGPRVKIVSLDVDQNPVTASRFRVRSMPTLVYFSDGAEVDRRVGAEPQALVKARIEANLAGPAQASRHRLLVEEHP